MSLDDLTHSPSDTKPKRSRAWLLPVGLVVGFILIMLLFFGDRLIPAAEVKVSSVVSVRAGQTEQTKTTSAAVSTSADELLFQASGWVEPDPYTVYVPTLISGVVEEVLVLEGATVQKGDLLASLVSDDAQLDVDAAVRKYASMERRMESHLSTVEINNADRVAVERKVDAIQSRVDDTQDSLTRISKLKSGSVSQQAITQAKLAVTQQRALLAEAKAEIPKIEAKNAQILIEHEAMEAELRELATLRERAELSLQRTKIVAPMDGVVLKLHAAPGRKRMLSSDNTDSAVIVELYDPAKLQARIDVPLNEAAALQVGQRVEMVSDLLVDQTFSGRVTRITGQADLQRNTLQVKVSIDKPDTKLRPDMLMRAKFYGSSGANTVSTGENASNRLALYVDEGAISASGSVWVVSADSTAEQRDVTLSSVSRDGYRLVLSGLRSGENVILPPHGQLRAGMRVKPIHSK